MNALILAAGFGTRLKPWTDSHPKALVPIGGTPMLERVIISLRNQGFNRIAVNIHHFGQQIIDFIHSTDFGIKIEISDERETLLDTGGGILKAWSLFGNDNAPLLIHNVDIITNAPLDNLYAAHLESGNDTTLLVSRRESSRKLVFDKKMALKGWHNLNTNQLRPSVLSIDKEDRSLAFSGIHIVGPNAAEEMAKIMPTRNFPILDYYLNPERETPINGFEMPDLKLIDIGKTENLVKADFELRTNSDLTGNHGGRNDIGSGYLS